MAIVPLSAAPRDAFVDYLQRSTRYFRERGAAAVRWKYFDDAFNRGRDRGFVWLRGDRVGGFIGIVPAELARGDERAPLHWTCDWGLDDPQASPGMGVLLLRRAMALAGTTATLGGNTTTRTLVPRLAARTDDAAAAYYWLPLRADALFHLGAARAPGLARLTGTPLGRLPLPWPTGRARGDARLFDGVAPTLDRLFDALAPTAWTARYDVAHLRWALERCPGLTVGSCTVDGDRGPVAGAVFWHTDTRAVRHVRFALWARPDAGDAAHAVIARTISAARACGGALVSTLAGRWDHDVLGALARARFLQRPSAAQPLYVFSPHVDSLRGVNYLATDLAQRFSGGGASSENHR